MQFVTVRELRAQSADAWRRLGDERELVITSNGQPIAVLSAVEPEGLEESLCAIRRAPAATAAERMQRDSLAAGTDRLPPERIDAEIRAAREGRRIER